MPAFVDLTGKRFHRLVALKKTHKGKRVAWACRCDCGEMVTVFSCNLTGNKSKSCGCLRHDTKSTLTHGQRHTRTYNVWAGMKQRCTNTNHKQWADYGGRGITICDNWLDFENFFNDMGPCPEGMSIDRIDNNGGYKKDNCRWATATQQGNNKRTNRIVELGGETKTLAEWSRTTGVPAYRISDRLNCGWSPHDAIHKPVRKIKKKPTAQLSRIRV